MKQCQPFKSSIDKTSLPTNEAGRLKIKRIGIDARFFGPKDKGFGRYTQKLIENLGKTDHKNQYFVFLRKERRDDYQAQNSNFKKVLADYRWYGWKEQIFLPLKLKKYKLDLIHFTHFNVPIFYCGKFVVTIHDLTLRHFPTYKKNFKNLFFYPFKNLAYRIVIKHAIKNSEKVIAISEYTKQEILKHYRIPPDKIEVIYEGVTRGPNFQFSNSNFAIEKIGTKYSCHLTTLYDGCFKDIPSFSK